MAHVDLLEQDELPDDYQYLLSDDAMGEINLLCAMANNPDLLQAYMRFGSTLWDDAGLSKAEVELLILSVASELDAEYEWQQHVPIVRGLDIDDDTIRAIGRGDFDDLSDRQSAIVRYALAVATGDETESQYEQLSTHVDESTAVGVTLLATHYLATARFLSALAVPLEDAFIGWNLSGVPER